LRQLPKDLEETYQYCVQRITLQDSRALKVLKWVSFASRPLHIEELKEAVAFDILDTAWDHERVPQKDFIIGCCANLVVLDPTDHCVRFAHSSVKQYLKKHRKVFVPTYPISEEQGELECGEFCVAYLSFSNFSMWLVKQGHEQTGAVVPNPVFLAGEAIGSTFRHFFQIPKHDKDTTTTLPFPRIRTASTPNRSQFKFFDYAIINWAPQTRHITQISPVWDKFEQLATNLNETWNFHPWDIRGRSKSSHLHGLLGWAVKERHEPLLSIALNSGKYIQQVCNLPLVDEKLPALHVASKLGYYEIVKRLLEICNVNSLDIEDYTPLHHAASKGHVDITRLILSTKGAVVNFVSKSKATPLWLASANGHDKVVSLLIEKKANIEVRDVPNGQTPLCQAAENGHYSVVELLLRNGANIESKDKNGLDTFVSSWEE
jgi:Ankyrin repeats (3 copies)/Ankyrin repeat